MFGKKRRTLLVAALAAIGAGGSLAVFPAPAVRAADAKVAPNAKEPEPWRHEKGVFFVRYLPDGKRLLSHSWDSTIRLWETPAGKEVRRFKAPYQTRQATGISHVNLAPDGRTLVIVEWDAGFVEQTIVVQEVTTGKELSRWKTRTGANALAFAPDGKSLISRGRDLVVHRWDVANGRQLGKFGEPSKSEYVNGLGPDSLVITPDGNILSAWWQGDDERFVTRWELNSGKQLPAFKLPPSSERSPIVFAADGRLAAWPRDGAGVCLWDMRTNKELRCLGPRDDVGKIEDLAFSADGKLLATRNSSLNDQAPKIRLWEVESGKQLREIADSDPDDLRMRPSSSRRKDLTFSPDSKFLATGTVSGLVYQWEVATGKKLD